MGTNAGADLGRILISGANGCLGRRLIRRLAAEGVPRSHVRALVRSERAADTLRALPEELRPEIVVVDYNDGQGLAEAVADCDSLIHLVGILKETATTRYTDAHETTTFALVRAAAAAGLRRIVYLSILGADASSRNACLRSKANAENILLQGRVPATVIRLPMVLGPGDVASAALRGQANAGLLPLVRAGATLEQPIDADDVVEAVLRVLRREDLGGKLLEMAGPESLPHRELVMRASSLYGRRPRVLRVPYALARLLARLCQWIFANPPFTPAMLAVLEHDDAIDAQAAARSLGMELTPLDETLRRSVGPEASVT